MQTVQSSPREKHFLFPNVTGKQNCQDEIVVIDQVVT